MATEVHHYQEARAARVICGTAGLSVGVTAALEPLAVTTGGAGLVAWLGLGVGSVCLGAWACRHLDATGLLFEYLTQRKFKAVCRAKGLTTKDDQGRHIYPRLDRLIVGGGVLHARIRPHLGQSVHEWELAGPAFALAFHVQAVRFRQENDGTLALTVGYQRLEMREATVQPAEADRPLEAGVSWSELLETVAVGTTEGGRVYHLPFLGGHILCVGRTGSGKGSTCWSLLIGLVPAIRAGVVRCWGIDQKRLELAIGRGFFGDRYATTDEQAVGLLERMVAEMEAVGDSLAGVARKVEPSPTCPVNLLVIDELMHLSALMTDRNLRLRAEKALNRILSQGRALGYVVFGALQDPRKETLPNRDLWPVQVALRLPADMVDLVLGRGMRDAGAVCDQIPTGKAGGAGMGFCVSEDSGIPQLVRFTWCGDDLIRKASASLSGGDAGGGFLPKGT